METDLSSPLPPIRFYDWWLYRLFYRRWNSILQRRPYLLARMIEDMQSWQRAHHSADRQLIRRASMNEPDRKYTCAWCGDRTHQPVRAFLEHFRLVEWGQWKYWRGNIRMFGFWSGLGSSICLSFPIVNALVHWRYRKMHIELK